MSVWDVFVDFRRRVDVQSGAQESHQGQIQKLRIIKMSRGQFKSSTKRPLSGQFLFDHPNLPKL